MGREDVGGNEMQLDQRKHDRFPHFRCHMTVALDT
jgi:hypothetical protein